MLLRKNIFAFMSRRSLGALCAAVGVAVNLLLCAVKLIAGMLASSAAVTSDGVHSLADALASLLALLSFLFPGRRGESGLTERIAAAVIALALIFAGATVMGECVSCLRQGKTAQPSTSLPGVMLACAAAKALLAAFLSRVNRRLRSAALEASLADSLCDCLSTATACACACAAPYFAVNTDAVGGAAVSVIISATGLRLMLINLKALLTEPSRACKREISALLEQMQLTAVSPPVLLPSPHGRTLYMKIELDSNLSCEGALRTLKACESILSHAVGMPIKLRAITNGGEIIKHGRTRRKKRLCRKSK